MVEKVDVKYSRGFYVDSKLEEAEIEKENLRDSFSIILD